MTVLFPFLMLLMLIYFDIICKEFFPNLYNLRLKINRSLNSCFNVLVLNFIQLKRVNLIDCNANSVYLKASLIYLNFNPNNQLTINSTFLLALISIFLFSQLFSFIFYSNISFNCCDEGKMRIFCNYFCFYSYYSYN